LSSEGLVSAGWAADALIPSTCAQSEGCPSAEDAAMSDQNDSVAQAVARIERYREQLAVSPIVDVLGVVSPGAVGVGQSAGEGLSTFSLTLDPWRFPRGKLQAMVLYVRGVVTNEDLSRFQRTLRPYSVIRLKARVGVHPGGFPDALLEAVVGLDGSDAEMNQKAAELQRPTTFNDPVLGTFILNREFDWFEAQVTWRGTPIRLYLQPTQCVTESNELENTLKIARALWNDQEMWDLRIRDYTVQEMLAMKNGTWLAEDEVAVTAEQFEDRMTLESTIYPDGRFEFLYDDGDLFWGHTIHVAGDIVNGPNDAGIQG
jgi:hypothetical protein